MGVLDFLKVKKGPMQTQIGEIEAQLERLRAERRAAETIVEGHGQKRSDMLLSDASDADIAKLDADAVLAQIRLERLELAELELIARLDAARDSVARSKRAASLDASAAAIEVKAQALDVAIGAMASAFEDLVRVIPAEMSVMIDRNGLSPDSAASPAEIAAAAVAQGLYLAAPKMFEERTWSGRRLRSLGVERRLAVRVLDVHGLLIDFLQGAHGENAEILPTSLAAQQILVAPMRLQAATLRASDDMREAAE